MQNANMNIKNVVITLYIDTTRLFVVKYTLIQLNIAVDEEIVIIGVIQRAYVW